MAKLYVVALFLCWTLPIEAQLKPRRHLTRQEMYAFLYKRMYKVTGIDEIRENIPSKELHPWIDSNFTALINDWLSGLNLHAEFFPEGADGYKEIRLTYKDVANSGLYDSLEGTVHGEHAELFENALVRVQGSTRYVFTNARGHFKIRVNSVWSNLIVSYPGFRTDTTRRSNEGPNMIKLIKHDPILDAPVVIAFGLTSKRLNMSSVFSLAAPDVGSPPSGSLQDIIVARVPGLFSGLRNGVAGAAQFATLGGTQSLQANTEMLYVVNGVPQAQAGSIIPVGTGSAQGSQGTNALNFVSPENIERIEFLKDAAATSIYGSRASNGVILVTLKGADTGAMRLSANVNAGVGHVVKTSRLLHTDEFLRLRQEAVLNDGEPVDSTTVPEGYYWGNSRNSNFQRLTSGGTARIWNGGLQATGGHADAAYFLSGQLHRETGVFPGTTWDQRASIYANLRGQNANGRLQLNFSGLYSYEGNRLPITDFTASELLAPNAPPFTKPNGVANWGMPELPFVNIPALSNNEYTSGVHSLLGRAQLTYLAGKHLSFEQSFGYNRILTYELSRLRLAGQDTTGGGLAAITASDNGYSLAMTNTVGRYRGALADGQLEGLVGADWQIRSTDLHLEQTQGFLTDQLLDADIGGTTNITQSSSPYRYAAVFGRLLYEWKNKYLLSGSWRRDGSSRLGDAHREGSFWALGTGWIFSQERFLAGNRILNFGKLRASLGTTGNEPNTDQGYAELYRLINSARNYQGLPGVVPYTAANPNLQLELSHRAELALELELFEHKLWVSAAASRSWTKNELILANVAPVAGVPGLLMNVPGIDLENRALEFFVQATQLKLGPLSWTSSLTLTIPRNKLVRWPGFDISGYKSDYVVGHSISVFQAYHWLGVDAQTGYYRFQTKNGNGQPSPEERVAGGGFDPDYYAGWSHRLQVGNFELNLLLDYRRQRGQNPLVLLARQNAPGMQAGSLQQLQGVPAQGGQLSNGPVEWLDHWQKAGDLSRQQRLTAGGDPVAVARLNDFLASDAVSVDASYLRLRSAGISYRLPDGWLKRKSLHTVVFYINGQNLLTWTHFPVTDPETQDPLVLPPLRSVVVGLRVSF